MNATPSQQWADLLPRLGSAVAMLAVGGLAIWAGGLAFILLVLVAAAGMIWELARMTRRSDRFDASILVALSGVIALTLNIFMPSALALLAGFAPVVLGLLSARRDRRAFVPYVLLLQAGAMGLLVLRAGHGVDALIWLLAVVIASDVLGYFAGRLLGGAKFWPAISPKKTWSGTLAGWVGAALVGLAFHLWGGMGVHVLWVSPLVAFAGQMGDILESAIKRRAGVKDSSNVIPGHGGLLDRFDALIVAAPVAVGLNMALPYLTLATG